MEPSSSISSSQSQNATSPIDGADLLDDLCDFIRRRVKLDDNAITLVALWIVWTWLSEHSYFQPRLAILSPEPGCGKTTLLRLLDLLVCKPKSSSSTTTGALFRAIADRRPTLLIDEADTFLQKNDEMRGIINAGFERTGTVDRCVGDNNTVTAFAVACPVAIAAIGTLSGTIMDRSIVLEMQRKEKGVKLESVRVDKPGEAQDIRERIEAWASANASAFAQIDPNMPDLSSDRATDKLRPLIAIADLAGNMWPTTARQAAIAHDGAAQASRTPSEGVQLLTDIRRIRDDLGTAKVTTSDLLNHLCALDESPWNEAGPRGRPLNARGLAQRLKPYGIQSGTHRFSGQTMAKGYEFADFEDAFRRYLPDQQGPLTATRNSVAP